MSRVRVRRLMASERLAGLPAITTRHDPWGLPARAEAADRLDLSARVALASDLQHSAGNGATRMLIGLARTDRRKEPPDGQREIMEAGSGGTRGLTRTSYPADAPLFRVEQVQQVEGGAWAVRPTSVRPPSLDHEVLYPAPGRHRLRDYGTGGHYLDVTGDWSNRIYEGEGEHVGDIDRAWAMTWGRITGIINDMAAGDRFTGQTAEAAQQAAWAAFKRRLPAALRPAGDRPTTAAQEATWGADDEHTIFRQLMGESRRARDRSGWHTPMQGLKEFAGDDRIDELTVGSSRIGQVPSRRLMQEAWARITGG